MIGNKVREVESGGSNTGPVIPPKPDNGNQGKSEAKENVPTGVVLSAEEAMGILKDLQVKFNVIITFMKNTFGNEQQFELIFILMIE